MKLNKFHTYFYCSRFLSNTTNVWADANFLKLRYLYRVISFINLPSRMLFRRLQLQKSKFLNGDKSVSTTRGLIWSSAKSLTMKVKCLYTPNYLD